MTLPSHLFHGRKSVKKTNDFLVLPEGIRFLLLGIADVSDFWAVIWLPMFQNQQNIRVYSYETNPLLNGPSSLSRLLLIEYHWNEIFRICEFCLPLHKNYVNLFSRTISENDPWTLQLIF